jgi:histidyl-tRNA synthetase
VISEASLAHFEQFKSLLADAGLCFTINPRLVRGLDYYNRTVFEWVATSDELGSQGTVAGGGRYDNLFELLGGEPNYACGFAIGIERMILLLAARGAAATAVTTPLAYVVHVDGAAGTIARAVAEQLRDAGHAVVVNAGGGSFKSQLKKADASGAAFALIVGDDEAAAGSVAIKPLRAAGEQVVVATADVVARMTDLSLRQA